MKNFLRLSLLAILTLSVASVLKPSGQTHTRRNAPAADGARAEAAPAGSVAAARGGIGAVTAASAHGQPPAAEVYGKLPLQFEENQGQTDAQVKYLARGRGYLFFVTPQETVLALRRANVTDNKAPVATRRTTKRKGHAPDRLASQTGASETVLRFRMEGASATPKIAGTDRLAAVSNYFIGSDPAKWRTEVPNFGRVTVHNLYPGIDAAYYGNEGRVESDFIVAPGRDPGKIRLAISGARSVSVNPAGDLVLSTAEGEVRLAKPTVYQEVHGERRDVAGGYELLGATQVGLKVSEYDHRLPLVIDPTIVYSTYLGGSGNQGDVAFGIAVDATGAYVTGQAQSPDFPLQNPEQGAPGGPGATNAFITKFAPSGTSLIYSTFIGGSGFDQAHAIAIDGAGEAYITGNTSSPDFPKTTGPGLNGTYNAFVTKLSASGNALVFSLYLGGNSFDFGQGIAVDSGGNAFVVGQTSSTTFPVTTGTFQQMLTGSENAFVSKFSSTGTLTWSTYLGGEDFDQATAVALALDPTSGLPNVYVTGSTSSARFPTQNPIQANIGADGAENAFITELNFSGTALVYSTYLGGMFDDLGSAITVDSGGNTIVVGSSGSPDFPTLGSLQGHDDRSDLFVAKLAPGGGSLVFCTLFGDESGSTQGSGVALDGANNIYVTGQTSALFFPTLNPVQATTQAGIFGDGFSDTGTAFIVEFKSDGSDYLFSTFFGGAQDLNPNEGYQDSGNGIAVDSGGNIYIAGLSQTADFPTVNPFQAALLSPQSNGFVAKISPATPAGPQVFPATLNLGPANVGSTTPPQILTIANGTGTLNFTGFTFAGANPADFTEMDSCGPTLLPHVVCTVAITATPGGTGTRTATLQINDSDASSPQTVSLTATGGSAGPPPQTGTLNITPMPSLPAFGPTEVGTQSGGQSITVTNTGTVTVNFFSERGGTDAGDFDPFFGGTCTGTLTAGANCTVNVIFQPTAAGLRNGTIDFTGNFTGSPASVGVSGTGIPNQLMVSTTLLTFPNTVVRTTSAAQSITITNTSSTTALTGISFTGPGAPFAISANTCGVTLAPSGNCMVSVTFTPTTAVESFGFIRIMSNDPVNGFVSIFGTGLNPFATLAPISTNLLPFPRQAVGTTSAGQDIFLQNIGNTDLVFTAPVTGANAADFAEADFCGATIPVGGFCLVTVTFTPGGLGARSATLTFNSATTGVTGVPQTVSLSGTGVTATTAAVTPTSLLFPNEPVGTMSPPQLVTFSNTGNRQLTITNVALGGANPADFQFTFVSNGPATIGCSGPLPGAIYNPDVACPISFTFTPTANGPRSATLMIADSASNSPQIVTLQGTGGNGPAVMLAPTPVSFGTVSQGTTSAPMTVTLTNTGTSPLMFTAAPALSGTNAADFAITATTCAVATPVAALGTCTVTLTFTPSVSNVLENATLTFADNATPATQTVPISGTGSAAPIPVVSLPATVAFGVVPKGTPSAPMVVTLTNTGTASLNFTSAPAVTGANAGDFAISGSTCAVAAAVAANGGTCTVTLVFTPATAAGETATLNFADDASPPAQMVALTGTGTLPVVTFTPAGGLNFGPVVPMTPSAPMSITLQVGAGTGTLQLSSVTIVPGTGTGPNDYAFAAGTTCPMTGGTVAAGTSCVVNIIFTPSVAGTLNAALVFAGSNLTGSPVSLPMTGLGASTAAGFVFTAMTPGNGGIGTNVSILAGDTVTFTLVLQPNPGFIGPISISCVSGIPATIATANPTMINVTTTPSQPFTVTCTLQTNCVTSLVAPKPRMPGGPWNGPVTPVEGLIETASALAMLLALVLRRMPQPWAARLAPALALMVLLTLMMATAACTNNLPPPLPNQPTTPTGVYQIQIVATAPGGVKQMVPLTVHVI